MKTERKDIYQEVTDRIIAQLEQGIIPWNKPWTGTRSGAISGTTGKAYSLLNQMLLLKPGRWYTYKQAQSLGGQVRKGEKGSMVVFWKQVPVTVESDNQDGEQKKLVPMLRYYTVFHADQIDGLPEAPTQDATVPEIDATAEETIAAYLDGSGVTLEQITTDEAYYSPSSDRVRLPRMEQFQNAAEYYSTAFHELVHSTGHSSRLNRLTGTAHFGSEEYSREELVAEIGAATLVNCHGMETPSTLRNSAAYVQSWLRALRNDKKMIVSAAGKAAKAVDFILDFAPATLPF